jgi:hypothetical protein
MSASAQHLLEAADKGNDRKRQKPLDQRNILTQLSIDLLAKPILSEL